jgi:hypothetical protein
VSELTHQPKPQSSFVPPAVQIQTPVFAPPQVQQAPATQSNESSQDLERKKQQYTKPNLYAPNPIFSGNGDHNSTKSVMQRKWQGIVQRVKEGRIAEHDPSHTYTPMHGSTESVMQRKGLEIAQRLKETRAKQRQTEIQAKLAIGAVGDKYEQEADRVAAQVVQRMNAPESVQREEVPEEEEELQMKPAISSIQREAIPEEEELQMKPEVSSIQRHAGHETGHEEEELQAKSLLQRQDTYDGGEASADLESSIQSARGSGQSLDPSLQAKMGEAMGADFSSVKVHTDSQSDQLNKSIQAKAFTTGQDVFFRQGAYDPGSRGGQELIAHELTHVVQQSGGKAAGIAQLTLQRKALDADTILSGVPTVLAGNSLLPKNGELSLDTVLFGDKSLKARIENIIGTYEAQFQKEESKTAVSHNAQKVLAAFQTIGMAIARKLHMGQEGHIIAKALLASQKDRLISELKTNTSEDEKSNALSETDAEDALKMAEVLAGEDPVGMYAQDKTSLKKADASIRVMASELKKTPLEVFELLRHQFESKIGSLSLKDVKAGEMKAPEGYTFPLKDLYGEVSENFFKNLLDLDENGKAKWEDTGLKTNKAPKTWKDQARSFKTNDINNLRESVSKEIDPKDAFSIKKEVQEEKGWERLNNSQMEYLTDVEDEEGGQEAAAKERIISYFTETKKLDKEKAIETMNEGISNLEKWPITLTTKSQDMLKSNGEIIDSYKPFFSVFEQEKRVDKYLPNLKTDSTVKIVEDVLGRGLDYGQERKEKDEQQVGFDSPLSLTDLPAMSCINHAYELNQGPNYYGDTHFVLNPNVRKRSVFAYGTACPERRSFILVLDDILSKEPKSVDLICNGEYKLQDIEVHVYGNIELRKDIVEFHLGNPNALIDADTRGGVNMPGMKGTPTEKLKLLKTFLLPEDVSRLKNIWIKKQKGHEKLKGLVKDLGGLVTSNIDEVDVTQEIDEVELAKEVVPEKDKGKTTKKKKGCCYITTACVTARGLSDDCEELQTLRQFRDRYMFNLPSGQDLVKFYYEQSPKIVDAIESSDRSQAIYEDLYKVIRECVDIIHKAHYQKALTTYITMVLKLRDEFTPDIAVPHSLLDATLFDPEVK